MHSVSVSSLDALVQVVAKITGVKSFLEELKIIEPLHLSAKSDQKVIVDASSTWKHIGKVFGLRHMLCHEMASEYIVDQQETYGLLLNSQDFMAASAIWLDKLQYPNPCPTNEERLAEASHKLFFARKHLQDNLSMIAADSIIPEKIKSFIVQAAERLHEFNAVLAEVELSPVNWPFEEAPAFQRVETMMKEVRTLNRFTRRLQRYYATFIAGRMPTSSKD